MAVAERNEQIGANVKSLRGEMSQDELAKRMREYGYKWSKATVWAIEKGERPLKLTEAKDLLSSLGLDWRTQIPDLLLDNGVVNLYTRYSVVSKMRDRLTDSFVQLSSAYLDLLLAAAQASDEDRRFAEKEFGDMIEEASPEGVAVAYWGEIDGAKDEYYYSFAKNAEHNGGDWGAGLSEAKQKLPVILGKYWQYIDPDADDEDMTDSKQDS